ncbi:MAG: hypothetical protein ACRC7O_15550 [Fimbriiglobus sp.]
MTPPRRAFAALALILLAAPGFAADPPRTADDIARDLSSPSYTVRDKATRDLWSFGPKATAVLRKVRDGDDPEASRRAGDVLAKFASGIFPDTPPEVLQLIREFRTGGPEKQPPAVTALVKHGPRGVAALRALLSQDREWPPDTREPLFDHLTAVARRAVPPLILAGRLDDAEEILSLHALGPSEPGITDYAVFLGFRNRAAIVAADLETVQRDGGPPGEAAARALVFVHRAAGNSAKAKAAAAAFAAKDPDGIPLTDSLLEDLGAWPELADHATGSAANARGGDALRIFRLRLAGRTKEADELADEQKDRDTGDTGRAGSVDEPTLALMLGGRPLDGIDRMRAKRNLPHILADVLAARLKFRDALDLVGGGAARQADDADGLDTATLRLLYGTRKGRLLAQLGDRDAAAQVFHKLADQLGTGRDDTTLTQLLRAEVRAGRYDLACEHAGKLLAAADPDGERKSGTGRQEPFEAVFDQDADAAQYWWAVFRTNPPAGETPGTSMRLVRALLTGEATPAEFERALTAANREMPPPHPDTTEGYGRALGLAAAYRAAGKPADAIAVLTAAADQITAKFTQDSDGSIRRYGRGARSWVFGTDERFRLWLELGDLLMDAGKFADAAKRYEQGWKWFPDNGLLLYLSGRALTAAGENAEGKRRTDLAHWVSLGNPRIRGRFLEELVSRGHTAAARRERDLIRESGWRSDAFLGNVWNQVARASVVLREFDAAAAANRRAVHYLLRTPGVSYVEGFAYLTVPQLVGVHTARGLLAAGKTDAALAAAAECLTVLPGNTDVPLGLVPDLDKLGRTKDADALYRRVADAYAGVLRDHPDSAWALYSSAWLAAGCRRDLDTALIHGKKAVELDPDAKTPREVLAEVHFRRGDRADAVAVMAKLAAADPRNPIFRRQLDRYRTAGFDSPLLGGADD